MVEIIIEFFQGLKILGLIGLCSSISGLYLVGKQKIIAWPIWIIGSFFWIAHFIIINDLSGIILFTIYIPINVHGWIKWKKLKLKKWGEKI